MGMENRRVWNCKRGMEDIILYYKGKGDRGEEKGYLKCT